MKRLAVLFLVCILLFAVFIVVGFNKSDANSQNTMPMDIIIGDYLAINVDNDSLHLGAIKPGNTAKRSFYLVNNGEPKLVTIGVNGDLAEWAMVSDNKFVLGAGEKKEIGVFVAPPEGTKFKKYESLLKLSYEKAGP